LTPFLFYLVEQLNAQQQLDEFGEPVALSAAEAEQYVLLQQQAASASASSKPARTWAQWAQYKVTAPFESTITAVGISYWLANMLSAGINSRVSVAIYCVRLHVF
jgi:type IV secretory pathway VirB2 component (pilin)